MRNAWQDHIFENEYIFNLNNGNLLENENIPFQAFFTLNGYLDFIDKYWLNDIKATFKESITDCEGTEPYCTYYDIEDYRVENNDLKFSITSDCYPHVAKACSPYLTKTAGRQIDIEYRLEVTF